MDIPDIKSGKPNRVCHFPVALIPFSLMIAAFTPLFFFLSGEIPRDLNVPSYFPLLKTRP
jgi:hypothetical protein